MELDIPFAVTGAVDRDGERELVERAKRDRQAFALLYRRYRRPIGGYIFRRVGDPHVTEDLVADVFISALEALPHYRHRGLPFRIWLYRIATNRANRWARRERKRMLQHLEDEPAQAGGTDGDARAQRDRARQALLALAQKYQTVLALHYLEGMPIQEVALAIGCRVGTVKSRLARGREALRARLQQRRPKR